MKLAPSKLVIVLMLALVLLVPLLPIRELNKSASINQETPSLSLSNGLRGIEFPVVRQRLQKMELAIHNVCELVDLGDSVPRLLVSTTLDQSIGGIQIVLIEDRLAIFSVEGTIFDQQLSESVDKDCGIKIVIENSALFIPGKDRIELSVSPKFSLLVVDEEIFESGTFAAVLTTETYGTHLSLFAIFVRILCLSCSLLLIERFISLKHPRKISDV